MKKNIAQVKKIKYPGFLVTGAIAGAITLLYAFAPMPGKNTPWIAPATADAVKNPIASDAASIEAGKAVYKKSCYDCHGKKGKGDGPKSGELDQNPQDFTKPEFQKQTDGALSGKSQKAESQCLLLKVKLLRSSAGRPSIIYVH